MSKSPIVALILCGVLTTSCGGSAEDDPAASSGESASKSETPAPAPKKCTTEFYSECAEVWFEGRAVPAGLDVTRVQFLDEDPPDVYVLDFDPVGANGDPVKLPSGYEPQTNGGDSGFYYDYVLTKPLEAGTERQPYRLQGVNYTRRYLTSPQFKPLTSVAEIEAAVGTGKLRCVDNDQTPCWGQSDTVYLISPTR